MSRSGWGDFNSRLVVYVCGDYITDVFQPVKVSKVAPDGPIPVCEMLGEPTAYPGGAGNVARQFRYLSNDVTLACYSFPRQSEGGLRFLSRQCGHDTKTRLIENGRIIARLDTNTTSPRRVPQADRERVTSGILDDLAANLRDRGAAAGRMASGKRVCAVLSDYALGFWNCPKLARRALLLFRSYGVPTVVDPKPRGLPLQAWKGADVIKLNVTELAAFGFRGNPEEAISEAAQHVPGSVIVATYGRFAPIVYGPGFTENGNQRGVLIGGDHQSQGLSPWVNGAGDCFAAYLAAGLAKDFEGKLTHEAVRAAHNAAGVYTTHDYNSPVHPREIGEQLNSTAGRIYIEPGELAARISALPERTKIGYANGRFDLLHAGHVATLEHAASLCDWLVVFVNTDESVKRLKGRAPVMNLTERCHALAGLRSVNAVIPFGEDTPAEMFAKVGRCDVLVKGPDYAAEDVAGREWAASVEIAPEVFTVRASEIVKRCRDRGEVKT